MTRSQRIRRGLLALAAGALIGLARPSFPTVTSATTDDGGYWQPATYSGVDEARVTTLVNAQRSAPLTLDRSLSDIARLAAQNMSAAGGTSYDIALVKAAGYCYVMAGEAVGVNTYPDDQSTQVAVDGWLSSSTYRSLLLGSTYTVIGVGAYEDASGQHWFAAFAARPCATATPSPSPDVQGTEPPQATPMPTPAPSAAPGKPTATDAPNPPACVP